MMATLKNNKIIRFGAIGVLNTVIDFGILLILNRELGVPVVIANVISTSVAFMFSFSMNKKYTFKTSNTDVRREFILFLVVTLTGLWILQNLIIAVAIPALSPFGFTPSATLLIAKLLATVVSLVWNYFLYDRVVFVHKKGE
jgi:putative flippase GtrA